MKSSTKTSRRPSLYLLSLPSSILSLSVPSSTPPLSLTTYPSLSPPIPLLPYLPTYPSLYLSLSFNISLYLSLSFPISLYLSLTLLPLSLSLHLSHPLSLFHCLTPLYIFNELLNKILVLLKHFSLQNDIQWKTKTYILVTQTSHLRFKFNSLIFRKS